MNDKLPLKFSFCKHADCKGSNYFFYFPYWRSVYGPNTEIEWNRAGARGFCLLPRIPPQTALAIVADKASKLGDRINLNLDEPCKTTRERKLTVHSDEENDSKLVTSDPSRQPILSKSTKIPAKTVVLGKELGTEVSIKSKKMKATHSNTKIQQLYNTHSKPLLMSVRKSPGLIKRGPLAKRKKKQHDEPDVEKPMLISPSQSNQNVIGEDSEMNEPVDEANIITESVIGPTGNHPEENVVAFTANIENQHEVVVYNSELPELPKPIAQSSANKPVTSLPVTSAQPTQVVVQSTSAQQNQIHPPETVTNSRHVPQSFITNKVALMQSPANATTLINKEAKIQMVDQSNPRFVKYYDQNSLYIRNVPVQKLVKQSTAPITSTVVVRTPAPSINKPILPQGNIAASIPTPPTRIPPKINILSQQTIKSNVNFVPLSDNKVIIKPNTKLANVLKSQQFQVLPSSNNLIKSNMIIRGTNHMSPRKPNNSSANNLVNIEMMQPVESLTAFNRAREEVGHERPVYVLNMANQATTMAAAAAAGHVHKISTIQKIQLDSNVITEETPIDFIAASGGNEYIIEEVDTYETPHVTQMASMPYNKGRQLVTESRGSCAKVNSKIPKGVQFTTISPRMHTAQPSVNVVYEPQSGIVSESDWEISQNSGTIIQHHQRVNHNDYDSNVIYAESLHDDNIAEEYVTTEEYDGVHGKSYFLLLLFF